jgi:hypothetical protein
MFARDRRIGFKVENDLFGNGATRSGGTVVYGHRAFDAATTLGDSFGRSEDKINQTSGGCSAADAGRASGYRH